MKSKTPRNQINSRTLNYELVINRTQANNINQAVRMQCNKTSSKNLWLFSITIIILLKEALPGTSTSIEYTPVISTRYGQLRGMYTHIPEAGRVATYLGIPYATPPVGPNRLSPTRAPSQWKGILDATTHPAACPQNPPEKYRHLLQRQSEDCLYLNLYVPGKMLYARGTLTYIVNIFVCFHIKVGNGNIFC